MSQNFSAYLRKIRQVPLSEQTEHTGRAALEELLNEFATEAPRGNVTVQHEPKRVRNKGAPDFKIFCDGMVLGYVETKQIGEDLGVVLESEQIKRYKDLSENIILTDYIHFIWISKDGLKREVLCEVTDLQDPKFRPGSARIAAVAQLLGAFFSTAPQGIGCAQQLALALATRSRLMRDHLGEELVRQGEMHQEGRLYGLYLIFRDQVFHELRTQEFADAFAQMLAYGLFLARLNAATQTVTLSNARTFVPGSFRLIRELVDFLVELEKDEYREVRWVVEEVLSIVNGLDLPAIHDDLSFRHRRSISSKLRASEEEEHRLFKRDPFIYFYEDYLRSYDQATRKARGVYYTPPPVVNFIVRAVDDILKGTFKICDGLADHNRVTVLDFACGTGTFLLEVFRQIFDNVGGIGDGRSDLIKRDHILKNIFGFEYLIAPYTIAHLKISQYLENQKNPLINDERLQIFLTNTLEPIEPQPNLLLPAISAEVEAAQAIKERPILVIVGNPPYSGHSKNKGRWITEAIDGYKFTLETENSGLQVRKPLGERNPKWLNDDYVKFIRFAQLKMDAVDEGVVGIITNHSWLDNPTFRGMRQSLMRSFQQIYILDLHGSVKKKEQAPDGSKDENVFDIEQGVAISLFVKRPGLEIGVWRGDFWGMRLTKYKSLADSVLSDIVWQKLEPTTPFFLFTRQELELRDEYEKGWRLPAIFPINVLGFQTHRDAFAISFTSSEMENKLREFMDPTIPDDALTRRYGLKSNRDWSFPDARAAALSGAATPPRIVAYRPFDDRWSEFSHLTIDFPRRELLKHVAGRANISLLAPRGIGTKHWEHAFVAVAPANDCVVSNRSREANQVYPLWRFGDTEEKEENIGGEFRKFLDTLYEHHYAPEEILGYIYAVMYASTYRERYGEFLRIDFPRVPFPESGDSFEMMSGLGWALVQAHLLHELPRRGLAAYCGKGNHMVETVRYVPKEQTIHINEAQSFQPVPQAVWDFHIGSYKVLEKYLKSRIRRSLTLDEIDRVGAIADSLAFTVDQMNAIDAAYRVAFPERQWLARDARAKPQNGVLSSRFHFPAERSAYVPRKTIEPRRTCAAVQPFWGRGGSTLPA